jgi:Domain of unknown function (DUF4381)
MREMDRRRRPLKGVAWLAVLAEAAFCAGGTPPAAADAAGTAQSTSTPTAEDIRDIRGPKALPGSWLLPALITGTLVIVLGGYVVWRRHQRAIRPRDLTLSEQALKRLEETRPLMRPATAREFGIAASEVIRSYIEKRFDVIATQRTTEEFLQDLLQNSNDSLTRHRSMLAKFLQLCDYVKFAGASLAVTDMESLFQSARSFVLETDPRTVV